MNWDILNYGYPFQWFFGGWFWVWWISWFHLGVRLGDRDLSRVRWSKKEIKNLLPNIWLYAIMSRLRTATLGLASELRTACGLTKLGNASSVLTPKHPEGAREAGDPSITMAVARLADCWLTTRWSLVLPPEPGVAGTVCSIKYFPWSLCASDSDSWLGFLCG